MLTEAINGFCVSITLALRMGELCGAVLAGGKSVRFGSDKALAMYQGSSLVQKSISLLQELSLKPTLIVSAVNNYPSFTCRKIEDLHSECGPLGGIYTALKVLNAPVLVLTCDMPLLKKQTLKLLIKTYQRISIRGRCLRSCDSPSNQENRKNASNVPEAIVFKINDRMFQPFPGIYHPNSMLIAQRHLNRNQLSMQDFLRALPSIHQINSVQPAQQFTNINYPSDLP